MTPRRRAFSLALSDGYATLQNLGEATGEATHAAIEEEGILSGRLDDLHLLLVAKADQVLDPRDREIYRARYLFPARKTKLKELADRYGLSEARVSQIAAEADRNVRAAIASDPLADCYREVRFPTWRTTSMIGVTHDQRSGSASGSFITTATVATNACWLKIRPSRNGETRGDHSLNRVGDAIDAGVEHQDIGKHLGIPTTTTEDPSFNPAAHLVKLAEWRRAAEDRFENRKNDWRDTVKTNHLNSGSPHNEGIPNSARGRTHRRGREWTEDFSGRTYSGS